MDTKGSMGSAVYPYGDPATPIDLRSKIVTFLLAKNRIANAHVTNANIRPLCFSRDAATTALRS